MAESDEEVLALSFRFAGRGDDGDEIYEITCPHCEEQVDMTRDGSARCPCGIEWSMVIRAVGHRSP